MKKELIQLHVNGERYEVAVPPNKLLLDALREDLRLTGAKRGCDDSSCGCCTVLVDGVPMLSCVMLAASYQDAEITTIEGVARGGELDPLQEGFCVEGGAQCGYCTPGIILVAKALLDRNPNPARQDIADALSGNLCRCTGYMQIYSSVEYAIKKLQQAPAEAVSERR
ncbi:MAG TPA: (2Fe-2S)-binding protein [Candidatus Acidoferrales bacterium]|nr:(2Fe-2S)-binding protein [Candidatus Acidoferrales bacterium]